MSTPPPFQNEFRFVCIIPQDKYDLTIAFYRNILGFQNTGG